MVPRGVFSNWNVAQTLAGHSCIKDKRRAHHFGVREHFWVLFLSLLRLAPVAPIFCLAISATFGAATALKSQEARSAVEAPAQLLLVASDPAQKSADRLVAFLSSEFDVQVTLIGNGDYVPLIDEYAYDGFVYLGNNYFLPPGRGFLSDMSATRKPVFWVNYHPWLLEPAVFSRKGMSFQDVHSVEFDKVNFHGMRPLNATDTSLVEATHPARVFFWLYNKDKSVSLPGAVISGNFVYLSYLPALFPEQPDMVPVLAAARAAFSQLTPMTEPVAGPDERLVAARVDSFRTGIHLPFILEGSHTDTVPYESDGLHSNLIRIRETGAEWVILHQSYFQDGVSASEPAVHPKGTATFEGLNNIVRDAHTIGLNVRLSVVVNSTGDFLESREQRGFIWPSDREKWWETYRRIVLEVAVFAKENNIESLTIGSGLNRLEEDEDQWRSLVAGVRDEVGYNGLIGYQVNFDSLTRFSWGDALDYLAVSAYWPLATMRNEPLQNLIAAWNLIGNEVEQWLEQNPEVILEFGEIGYASQASSAVYPNPQQPNRSAPLSLEEQLICYLALEDFLRKHPKIAGVGIFASTPEDLQPGNIGYSPFGKPAHEVLRRLMALH